MARSLPPYGIRGERFRQHIGFSQRVAAAMILVHKLRPLACAHFLLATSEASGLELMLPTGVLSDFEFPVTSNRSVRWHRAQVAIP